MILVPADAIAVELVLPRSPIARHRVKRAEPISLLGMLKSDFQGCFALPRYHLFLFGLDWK